MNDLLAQEFYKKEKRKQKKTTRFKEMIQFVGNSSILPKWVQIEMGKTLKTINIDFKN